MVIVQINGGLGNQMFQYAAARSLALKNDCPLLLDTEVFKTYKVHEYSLPHLSVLDQRASAQQLQAASRFSISRLANKIIRPSKSIHRYKEPHFHFDSHWEDVRPPVYLEGYFQSEKYFQAHRDILLKEFQPKTPLTGLNQEMAQAMAGQDSVSLHIRRGDYVSNASATQFHGLTSLDYYRAAIERLRPELSKMHLYIFSDDLEWARENLKTSVPMTLVSQNQNRNYEDLRLMSCCKHHIIANSSFSWWGAWLNPLKAKKVIAPKNWFQNAPHDTKDLIPADWIRL